MAGMTSQITNLTNIVSQMNAQQVCDATCQANRTLKDKKTTYTKAQQNLHNAQPNFNRAEKDYIVAAKGAGYYSDMQEKKYKKIAQGEIDELNKGLSRVWTDLDTKLKYYKGLYYYSGTVKNVYNSYNNEYTNLVDEIQETADKKNVDFRLAHFYNYNTSITNYILYYLKIMYWIFYVIVLALFVLKKQYRNEKSWPFIGLVALFPLVFEWGINFNNPFKNEEARIPSIYDYVFDVFTHAKIDNIYFIFFTLVVLTVLLFSFFSELPFIPRV